MNKDKPYDIFFCLVELVEIVFTARELLFFIISDQKDGNLFKIKINACQISCYKRGITTFKLYGSCYVRGVVEHSLDERCE